MIHYVATEISHFGAENPVVFVVKAGSKGKERFRRPLRQRPEPISAPPPSDFLSPTRATRIDAGDPAEAVSELDFSLRMT